MYGKGSLGEIVLSDIQLEHPVRSQLENPWWWGLPHPWWGCSSDWSHCKKFHSYVEMKPLPVQLAPVAPCLLHVAPCEERDSTLSVAVLQVLEYSLWWGLPWAFSREKRPNSFSLSSQDRFSGPSAIFVALLWALSSLSASFWSCGLQNWAQIPGVAWQALSGAGDDHISTSAGTAQNPICLCCCSGTLLMKMFDVSYQTILKRIWLHSSFFLLSGRVSNEDSFS